MLVIFFAGMHLGRLFAMDSVQDKQFLNLAISLIRLRFPSLLFDYRYTKKKKQIFLNPFYAIFPFLNPLKKSESIWFSGGEEKENWPQTGWLENEVNFVKVIARN